jgi:citrate lyase subunit beta/citryl-CoA lyase
LSHGFRDRIALEIQVESPLGLLRLEEIACASERIDTLIFGPGDYAAAAGIPQLSVGAIEPSYTGDQWHYVMSRILTIARALRLQAIDGPYAAIGDLDGFREVARRSRALGFDGKWAIHPAQIEICNEVYRPTQTQFDKAMAMIASYQVALDTDLLGATVFAGEMIDEASRKLADETVRRGQAAGMILSEALDKDHHGDDVRQ